MYIHVHVVLLASDRVGLVQSIIYSQTGLFRIPWDPMKLSLLQRCPHFTGSFIHIYIALGPQLPVLIIEVSLF